MGNNNTRSIKSGAVFRQSLYDFPCPVSLGKYTPSFGLHRYKQGLRFVPSDDEGFTLQGDRQRLLYKGRRRSHRFTILGDTSFEYDCILEREPESNVISLRMEGAENYDFLRQPDFIKEPLFKGSYAVYKKNTMVGEGTGKLCHIHRPEIIDARGRRCWGELSVVGNELRIAIPEQWLAEAKYPVIVDPTIGTTTVGNQITGKDPNNPGYDRPWLDNEYALNIFDVTQNGSGICTAYIYCCNDQTDCYALPILYTSANSKPYMKKSQNENYVDVMVSTVIPNYQAGWRNNTFTLNGNLQKGDQVWFGFHSSWFASKFDYGTACYKGWFDYTLYPDYDGEPPPYINIPSGQTFNTLKWSWYFTYTNGTNYVRTLTQGVTLPDNRIITGDYKRTSTETAGNSTSINRLPMFFRNVVETINTNSEENRYLSAIRKVQDTLNGIDMQSFLFVYIRSVPDTVQAEQNIKCSRGFIRRLLDYAGGIAETVYEAGYYRTNSDTVQTTGAVFRGLLIFACIVTKVFVRDYLLGRFLKSKAEMSIKSCICREITLESRIFGNEE